MTDFEALLRPRGRSDRALTAVDELLGRIEEQAMLGDAELLSDLCVAVYNLSASLDYLRTEDEVQAPDIGVEGGPSP